MAVSYPSVGPKLEQETTILRSVDLILLLNVPHPTLCKHIFDLSLAVHPNVFSLTN
jgi:hypothetical protein